MNTNSTALDRSIVNDRVFNTLFSGLIVALAALLVSCVNAGNRNAPLWKGQINQLPRCKTVAEQESILSNLYKLKTRSIENNELYPDWLYIYLDENGKSINNVQNWSDVKSYLIYDFRGNGFFQPVLVPVLGPGTHSAIQSYVGRKQK